MVFNLTEQSKVPKPSASQPELTAVYNYLFAVFSNGEEAHGEANSADFRDDFIQQTEVTVLEGPSHHQLNLWFTLRASEYDSLHLRTQGYVGVCGFKLSNGKNITVEILPKTYRVNPNNYRKEDMGLLCKMIIATHFTKNLDSVPEVELAEVENTSLLDVFMKLFVERVNAVLLRGMNRGYVAHEENLSFIRGRLDVTQNLRTNYINRSKFYCQFDEFCEDIPENRLLFSALSVAQKVVADSSLLKDINACLFQFDEVSHCMNLNADIAAAEVKNLSSDYREAVRWSEWILRMVGLDMVGGQAQKTPSFMFDMASLFERYIAVVLEKKSINQRVVYNSESKYLATSTVNSNFNPGIFEQKPDYQIFETTRLADSSNCQLVADAKWKMLDNESDTLKLSPADVRQVYTYVKLFRPHSNIGVLILPSIKDGQFEFSSEYKFNKTDNDEKECFMWVLAYDLGTDKFLFNDNCKGESESLERLSKIIQIDI